MLLLKISFGLIILILVLALIGCFYIYHNFASQLGHYRACSGDLHDQARERYQKVKAKLTSEQVNYTTALAANSASSASSPTTITCSKNLNNYANPLFRCRKELELLEWLLKKDASLIDQWQITVEKFPILSQQVPKFNKDTKLKQALSLQQLDYRVLQYPKRALLNKSEPIIKNCQTKNLATKPIKSKSKKARLEQQLNLKAHFLWQQNNTKNAHSKRFLLACHGFHGLPVSLLGYCRFFYEDAGYNLCLIEQRSHHESQGETIAMGYYEAFDLAAWVLALLDLYGEDCEIVLVGISMGGATVLNSLRFDWPKQVRFVIADCGFSSMYEQFKYQLPHFLPKFYIDSAWHFANFWFRLWHGFNFYQNDGQAALAINKLPLLIVHGTNDKTVPFKMASDLFAASTNLQSETKLIAIPNLDHAIANLVAFDKLEPAIKDYLYKYTSFNNLTN